MKGILFILSAPSGVGKSTLAKAIIRKERRFVHSISYTTREPRAAEKKGVDYHFVSQEKFFELVRQKKFLEYAQVHGAYYGTPKASVEKALKNGKYLILAIDVCGADRVAQRYPDSTVRIFILAPNFKTWIARLKIRQENNWKMRIANAREEIKWLDRYDYSIINDNLPHALHDFFTIVRAEELKRNKKNLDGLAENFIKVLRS